MKVLFTSNIPSPYRVDFFNELSKYCELTVLFERKKASNRNDEWLKQGNVSFNIEYLKGINIGEDSAFCPSIKKYIKEHQFDIIIIGGYSSLTGMYAIQYLKNKKIPFVLNCDGGFVRSDNKIKYSIKKHFISSASAWLSSGRCTNEYLEHYGADSKKIFNFSFTSIREKNIINEPIPESQKLELRKELNIKENKVVIYVGQFIYRKGVDVLINSYKYLSSDVGLYIIGGKATDEYNKLKEELNTDNIHFLEFMQKDEIEKYYKMADVFVLPTREDIWGLVINEAMAYGLPVVTTDKCIAGLELIENDKNGYIVPVDDSKELAIAIEKILNNNDLKNEMALNNIKKIKEYTIENMAKEHFDILNKINEKGE